MRWRSQNPFAVNLLLLFPLKVLITLQIRAGFLTNLISIDVTDNPAILRLNDYPSTTLDPGALTVFDALFASESGRVHRLVPAEIGNFLENIYQNRINLIDRQLRPNPFFIELSAHSEANLLHIMRNEWEFYEVEDLDVYRYIESEIKLIEKTLQNPSLRTKLFIQAAPIERMCHIWTSNGQKEALGKRNILNQADWHSLRSRYLQTQIMTTTECFGEIDRYGTRECGVSGVTILKSNATCRKLSPDTPVKKVHKIGGKRKNNRSPTSTLNMVRNPRVLISEFQDNENEDPTCSTRQILGSVDLVDSQAMTNSPQTIINSPVHRPVLQSTLNKPKRVPSSKSMSSVPGNNPNTSSISGQANGHVQSTGSSLSSNQTPSATFIEAIEEIKANFQCKYDQTYALISQFRNILIDSPVTIVPTIQQARMVNDQIEALVETIRNGFTESEELKANLQGTIIQIIQQIFVTQIEMPETENEVTVSLHTNMALRYLKNLQSQVVKQRPFPMPQKITGKSSNYVEKYRTLMDGFSNKAMQTFETLLDEIKGTKKALADLDKKENTKTHHQVSTQELITDSPNTGTHTSYKQPITNHDCARPPRNPRWTFSQYDRTSIPKHDSEITDTFDEHIITVPDNNREISTTPNRYHRHVPEWTRGKKHTK